MVFQDHCTIMTLETELILAIKIYNSSFMYITIDNTGSVQISAIKLLVI